MPVLWTYANIKNNKVVTTWSTGGYKALIWPRI